MEKQTLSTDEKIKAIEAKLDGYLVEKLLDFTVSDTELAEIFEIGLENLGKLPYNKLSEYSFMLSRYNLTLQRELNKQRAIHNWAKRSIDYICLPKMMDHRVTGSYMSNEEVKMIAIRNNDVAILLWKLMGDKEQYITLMNDLSIDIRKMSDYLVEISRAKRFNNG